MLEKADTTKYTGGWNEQLDSCFGNHLWYSYFSKDTVSYIYRVYILCYFPVEVEAIGVCRYGTP